ncbi:hypothetical protein ACFLTB_03765 [Chloroflexota bacterium]
MSRLRTAFVCICLIFITSLFACAPGEPMIPPDEAVIIKENLGYALAPTWMPEGFEYAGPFTGGTVSDRAFTKQVIFQNYSKIVSMEETAGSGLFMIYPLHADTSDSVEKRLGLEAPEDAISEIDINGTTAYLSHGSWSNETMRRVAQLVLPLNPEWDYDNGTSIRFTIDVPDEDRVWVSISTIFSIGYVTDKDLIRIARSVVVVE